MPSASRIKSLIFFWKFGLLSFFARPKFPVDSHIENSGFGFPGSTAFDAQGFPVSSPTVGVENVIRVHEKHQLVVEYRFLECQVCVAAIKRAAIKKDPAGIVVV